MACRTHLGVGRSHPIYRNLDRDILDSWSQSIKIGLQTTPRRLLLLSPSVTHLERLLHRCENELTWLDMNINFQKSGCLRVGPHCDVTCAGISSSNGRLLPWVTEMRYLGVIFTNSRTLKCSLDAVSYTHLTLPTNREV